MKKLRSYQKILGTCFSSSGKAPKSMFIMFIMLFFIMLLLDGGAILLYPVMYALFIVYFIINSQNRLFNIIPVSKKYSVAGIYWFPFIVSLFFFIVLIILEFLSLIIISIFPLQSGAVTGITSSIKDWMALPIVAAISILIVDILLPLFFIRHKIIRIVLTVTAIGISAAALRLFRNALPIAPSTGEINFLKSIPIMPHYAETLLLMICGGAVLTPLSMIISYILYRGKKCEIC